MGCCAVAVVHIVRRLWYNGYDGRRTMCMAAAISCPNR